MKVTVEWLRDFVETEVSASQIGDTLTMLGFELECIYESPIGPVLDFKVTPNRGDCLSVLGVARELCAKDPERFKPTSLMRECVQGIFMDDQEDSEIKKWAKVEVQEPSLCPRYGARVFRGIEIRPSSKKVQERLVACGMRPINLIVDLTNYVMLELGQPLHAFDLDLLAESTIIVRLPKQGERITTLDGLERQLDAEMLLICDANKPVAIAGVMGGANSEVHPGTKNILLESAHFKAESIQKTRRRLRLSTDASYRFERYVDPKGVVRALNRFAQLLDQEAGLKPVRGVLDVCQRQEEPKPVTVRPKRWKLILGLDIPTAVAGAHLHSLGCKVKEEKDGSLQVTPPSWRIDLLQEDDYVEEIGRLYGYEKIPEELPQGRTIVAKEDETCALISRAREIFLRLGFTEVINHTFCAPSPLDGPYDTDTDSYYSLQNPVSPEFRLLRNSLLPGLMHCARKHPRGPLFLFEIGRIYSRKPGIGGNQLAVAFLMRGRLLEDHWEKEEVPQADFFAGKGVVQQFLRLMRIRFDPFAGKDAVEPPLGLMQRRFPFLPDVYFEIPETQDPRFDPVFHATLGIPSGRILGHLVGRIFWHPGEIVPPIDHDIFGVFGELRQSLTEEFHMTERVVLGEIFLSNLIHWLKWIKEPKQEHGVPSLLYKPFSPYPPIRRDIAIVVRKDVPLREIEKTIREEVGDILEDLRLIDRYVGPGIPEGHHSLAYAMVLRHPQRTLTDEEANEITHRVLDRLSRLGGRVR